MKIVLLSVSTPPSDQGLRSISSCLKEQGHKVTIVFLPVSSGQLIETQRKRFSKGVLTQLKDVCNGASFVGIGSMAITASIARHLLTALQPLNCIRVWGGIYPTLFPEKTIEFCDVLCRGEGELAMVELAEKLETSEDISQIPNLWVRKGTKIYRNPVRPYIHNLDSLPPPDYDIESHYILKHNKLIQFQERHLSRRIYFLTVRGCPHSCTYCLNRAVKNLYFKESRHVRSHSVDYVIQECSRVKRKFRTCKAFDFRADSFLTLPTTYIEEFADKYKHEIGLPFEILVDPLHLEERKIRKLIEAGLNEIIIGIQSGSERINWNIYNRRISKDKILRAIHILKKYTKQVSIRWDFIACNPYETEGDIKKTIDIITQIPRPGLISVNNLVFFPGSALYKRAVGDGIISNEEDTCEDLSYSDWPRHILRKKKNAYFNLIVNLFDGPALGNWRGILKDNLLSLLMSERTSRIGRRHKEIVFAVIKVGFIFLVIRSYLDRIKYTLAQWSMLRSFVHALRRLKERRS